MTIKRLILILLTVLAIAKVILSLGDSFSQPQIQSRLELYQTNLVLHAAEFQPSETILSDSSTDLSAARNTLIGKDPYSTAQKQYQQARKVAQTTRTNYQTQLQEISSIAEKIEAKNEAAEKATDAPASRFKIFSPAKATDIAPQQQQLESAITDLNKFINEADLKLGILQAAQGKIDKANTIWDDLIAKNKSLKSELTITETATRLQALWRGDALNISDTELTIKSNLDGWFQYRTLKQLYQLTNDQNSLSNLETEEQKLAMQAVVKLAIIGGISILGGVTGLGLLILLIAQLLLKKETSILATNSNIPWETPWDGEIIWQVLIIGFFFIGQILLPLGFGLSGLNPSDFSLRFKAFYVLVSYLLMAAGGLFVLYFSLKSFFPLPKEWFQFKWLSNWIFWGFGGYLIAVPLVVVVSLINQQFWQGQGGSNPILFLALEAQDKIVLGIFFFTASIAAPLFEEIIFRGFLLPSLTRYVPVWGSILISSLIFSIAHLSVSEVLPLTTLGIILGFVYTRSRNLLAPMLLHSLWNGGTLFSLFILGSQ